MKLLKKQEEIKNGLISASQKTIEQAFAVHRHDFFEIEYILGGSGEYTVDGVCYDILPGRVFFLTPASVHDVQTEHAELINIMFAGELKDSEALYRLISQSSHHAFALSGETAELIRLLAKETVAATERGDLSGAVIYLNSLLRKLSEQGCRVPDRSASHVQKAIIYLLENFTSDISLEDTAHHVGISKNYLSELFHTEVSIGYKTYLDDLRFHYIAKLLRFSNLTVTQAYENCGFDDYANFSRRFKFRFGMSPSEYRKAHRSG